MIVVFTDHAVHQMKERGISRESIIEAMRLPDAVIIQKNTRRQAIKLFTAGKKQYCLVIIYEQKRFIPSNSMLTTGQSSPIHYYFRYVERLKPLYLQEVIML